MTSDPLHTVENLSFRIEDLEHQLRDLHAERARQVTALFHRQTDAGRNVTEIAKRAGISRQAVYDIVARSERPDVGRAG